MKVQSISIEVRSPNEEHVISEMLYQHRLNTGEDIVLSDGCLNIETDKLQTIVWSCQNGFGEYKSGDIPSWVIEMWTELRNIAMINELIATSTTHDIFIMEKE